jgi:outer membrane protein TolC
MLKNSFILIFCLISSSYAISLNETINLAVANNKDLKSIEKSIDIANEQIKLSKKWNNPILTIGANDLHFDTSRRDLEPMQAQYIALSQTIPINGKLKLQEEISLKDKDISKFTYEDAKLKLKSKLIEYVYTLKVFEKKYNLLNEYQKNIKDLETLSIALYENNKVDQSTLLDLKAMYYKVELEKENLKNTIKNGYLKLEEITYEKIENIELSLELKEVLFDKNISTHPKIKILELNNQKYNKQALLEEAKKIIRYKSKCCLFSKGSEV